MTFIRKYWLVIFVTMAVAAFTGLPSIFFLQRMGDGFRGVYPVFNGDALFYQTRIQEIYDGHGAINHSYFFEHKDIAYPQQIGAEYFIYSLTKISGLSAPALQVIIDFVMPAIIFLLSYLLFKKIAPNEYTAVLFPLALYTVVMAGLFKPIHPQITLPLLLLFLIFWVKLILNDKNKWRHSVISGVFLGLLFLTYFYHWTFLFVVMGIYILIMLLSKSFAEIKYHALLIGIGVLIGIPYILRMLASLEAPFQAETMVRLGLYFSHLPESYPRLAVALVWLAFFIWFARYYKIEQDKKTQIVATLLIANVLYPNHQLITGVIFENAVHWSWMPLVIFIFSGHYIIGVLIQRNVRLWKNFITLLLTSVLLILPAWRLSTFLWPAYPRQYKKNLVEDRQYYGEVFAWINANTEKDAVILSDMQLMNFIPVYTAANVYHSYYAFVLPGSDQEIIERTLFSHFFEPEFFTVEEFGFKDRAHILWSFVEDTEKNTHTIARRWTIPYEPVYSLEKERAKVSEVYDGLVKTGWNVSLLKKYRLDYIIWDKNIEPDWNLEHYKELELVVRVGDVLIYRFK